MMMRLRITHHENYQRLLEHQRTKRRVTQIRIQSLVEGHESVRSDLLLLLLLLRAKRILKGPVAGWDRLLP